MTLQRIKKLTHVHTQLVDFDDDHEHLPIPVYSYIKPTMRVQFILHILLSMGHFVTEIDQISHFTIRKCLQYAKLIGNRTDEESLQNYSSNLCRRFNEEQLVYFSNSKHIIDNWIVVASDLFDSVIIHDEIPVTCMFQVRNICITSLFFKQEKDVLPRKQQKMQQPNYLQNQRN